MTADLARLRAGALAPLLAASPSALGECGTDPLARATTLAIATPEGEGDDFGVALGGPFVARELAACATRAIEARKGWPTSRVERGFSVVADATARGAGVVAVRDGGPLLYGGASYVRAMIESATGHAPSAVGDSRHERLRADVDAAALVVASLARADTAEGLRGLAVSASVGARVELRAHATCDNEATCAGLAKLALSAQDSLGPLARLTWLGAAVSRATIAARGATLSARVDVSPEEAREAIGAVLAAPAGSAR